MAEERLNPLTWLQGKFASLVHTHTKSDITDLGTIPSASSTTPSADTTSGSYGSGTSYARSNHSHPKSSLYAEATHSHTKSQISDFPSIPSKTSDLTNDGADGTNVFVANNDSRLSDARTPTAHDHDDRYYTESEVDDALDDKQDLLISGTNIKTINNTSLLGSGNITIGGGGSSVDIATSWGNPTSDSKVPSEKLAKDTLDGKANSSHTHTKSEITDFPSIPSKTSDLVNDGDGSNVFVKDNDSRLSNARTPLAHTHLSSDVTDLIDVIYPVGSIYMSVNSTSPQTLFGGTWEQIQDKFLLASGSTYSAGSTGGSADAVVVSHTHTIGRDYMLTTDGSGVSRISTAGQTGTKVQNLLQSSDAIYRNTVESEGESGTGKNMPPYLTVFVWKRTA